MSSVPVNTPETFGRAVHDETCAGGDGFTVISLPADAPAAPADGHKPGVCRLLQGDGANVIAFTFRPGQYLADHKAAHPITVQVVSGELDFTIGDSVVRLVPGVVIHVKERVMHRVDCPVDAVGESVLLLHMLTGERHDH